MKNPTAIFLICLHVFANTEFAQVYKIPAVFRHYQSHRASDPQLSFLSFLKLHYGRQANCDASDSKKHGHLPFKKVKIIPAIQVLALYQESIRILPPVRITSSVYTGYDSPPLIRDYSARQLRPPIAV